MKKMGKQACLALILTTTIVCVCGKFIQPPPSLVLRTFAEEETLLPCEFKPQNGATVIQVTWSREKKNGVKEQIITRHRTEGLQEFPSFAGRVRFTSSDPIKNSTLLILNTGESDQATYTCHISTFPSGNFESQISLTIWRLPISSLEPVILTEGESFRVAAVCRAVGLPSPQLSWETDIPGKSENRSSEDGVVISQYFLHPLRSQNGRNLDCLVWHPALEHPRRLSNTLVVHYPPDATVSGYDQSWSVNWKGAELKCLGVGNPQPHNYTWTRKGGVLPKGVSIEGNRLIFPRPLNKTDEGVYECEARNSVGSVKTEVDVAILDASPSVHINGSLNTLLLITVGGAAGVLLVIMGIIILIVSCHHKRRTRKLKKELTVTREEINNLSRQNSMRRINSVCGDPRIQNEGYGLNRMDSLVKDSAFSLEENSIICDQRYEYRESDYDSLGRPAIHPSYYSERSSMRRKATDMERQDRSQRLATSVRNSNMTMDADLRRDQNSTPLSITSGCSKEGRTEKDIWGQREGMPEGEEGDSTLDSRQITEALLTHFDYSNGALRPKPHPNSIILSPHSNII